MRGEVNTFIVIFEAKVNRDLQKDILDLPQVTNIEHLTDYSWILQSTESATNLRSILDANINPNVEDKIFVGKLVKEAAWILSDVNNDNIRKILGTDEG